MVTLHPQNALKPTFDRPPHVTFDEGTSTGLLLFTQTVTDEQLDQIKEKLPKIGGAEVVYTRADGMSCSICVWKHLNEMLHTTETKEREAHTKNISQVVEHSISNSKSKGDNRGGKSTRGGRGGGRGGAKNASKAKTQESKPLNAPPPIASTATTSATKRKADDDAGDDAPAKKAKTEAVVSAS
jgi:lupus La protein